MCLEKVSLTGKFFTRKIDMFTLKTATHYGMEEIANSRSTSFPGSLSSASFVVDNREFKQRRRLR